MTTGMESPACNIESGIPYNCRQDTYILYERLKVAEPEPSQLESKCHQREA